jgi:hypothetical protein
MRSENELVQRQNVLRRVDSNICEFGLELAGVGERYEKPDADIPAATYLANRLCVAFGCVIAVSESCIVPGCRAHRRFN